MAAKRRLTLRMVREAYPVVAQVAHRTPLLASRTFSQMADAQVYLKAENLQRTGSFKVRGASYRISRIPQAQRKLGVLAASAGNHAQGVALAAQRAGVSCTIVMPRGASIAKVEATRNYGAEVVFFGESFDEAQARAQTLAQEGGRTLIPAFDDLDVVAGQGTVGLELCEDLPDVDVVVVPVGGGGLIGGIASVVKALRPQARVYGVQTEACPAAALAFQKGRLTAVHPKPTIADGIAVGRPGDLTFQLMQQHVDDIVTVREEEIAHAMVLLLERAKLVVEGAGAVGLAAVLGKHIPCRGQRVAVLLSGGNVDPILLTRILDHGLAQAGRYLLLRAVVRDQPGQLARLLEAVAKAGGNVVEVVHQRRGIHLPLGQVQVEVTVETRDAAHAGLVVASLQEAGYALRPPPEPTSATRPLHFAAEDAVPPGL